jgi:ribosome-binding protein aMBF1 (putative translation factor)
MDHQDWITIAFNQNKKLKKIDGKEYVKTKETKLEECEESGKLSHKKMDISFGKELQKYRSSQNMTQKDIAQKLNIQVKDINEIESGKAKHNGVLMSKIKIIMKKDKTKI